MQIVWAKARRGIWGLGHVFEGQLYFTKDIVDGSFVPRNRKPKPIPKPEAKPAPKACPKAQACAIVQDEAQGWKGLLFHSCL